MRYLLLVLLVTGCIGGGDKVGDPPVTCGSVEIDCLGLDCMQGAAADCSPASSTVSSAAYMMGFFQNTTTNLSILGYSGGGCVLYAEIIGVNASFTDDVPEYILDSQMDIQKNQVGKRGWCTLSCAEVEDVITKWFRNERLPPSWGAGKCDGELFRLF